MTHKRSYAIIGTGAVGGLYGARLQQAGHDAHFLVHGDIDHVRAHGLRVESPWGDVALPCVHAYGQAEDLPPCDVVCVCLKTTHNHLLPRLLPAALRPGGALVLMQNGLGAEEEAAQWFPEARIAGAMCFLCSNKVGPGHIRHVDYGRILFGAYSPDMDETLRGIAGDFEAAGVPVQIAPSLGEARWRKLFWNIPYNGLSVVLQSETDEIMGHPATRELSEALMREVLKGARACGHDIEDGFVAEILDFTEKMKPYRTSMMLDFLARRPLEIEYIYERPLEAARRPGAVLPRIDALRAQLRFLDDRNRRESADSNPRE